MAPNGKRKSDIMMRFLQLVTPETPQEAKIRIKAFREKIEKNLKASREWLRQQKLKSLF